MLLVLLYLWITLMNLSIVDEWVQYGNFPIMCYQKHGKIIIVAFMKSGVLPAEEEYQRSVVIPNKRNPVIKTGRRFDSAAFWWRIQKPAVPLRVACVDSAENWTVATVPISSFWCEIGFVALIKANFEGSTLQAWNVRTLTPDPPALLWGSFWMVLLFEST